MAMEEFKAPALLYPPPEYNRQYFDQLVSVLRIYFNQLDSETPSKAFSYRAEQFIGGFFVSGVTDAITAAGATQATATEITTAINNVTVVAAAADALNIYPATGAQINALGANAAFSLAAGLTIQLFSTTTTQWFTF